MEKVILKRMLKEKDEMGRSAEVRAPKLEAGRAREWRRVGGGGGGCRRRGGKTWRKVEEERKKLRERGRREEEREGRRATKARTKKQGEGKWQLDSKGRRQRRRGMR